MVFRRLVLEDFGLYRGVQEIDLAPRQKRGRSLPVVLFGGKNGAGKSTIFEAILLCLYGKGAIGERVRQSEYQEYLFQRIHRSPFGLTSSRASVTVEFDFVQGGVRHLYEVTRSWVAPSATSASVDVSLDLRRDGQRLDDLDHAHWDDFLKELIPPGLSQLFFFDGEKIQRLADEQDSAELGRSVKSLLNLDLVERLSADLQVYVAKQAKAAAGDGDRVEIEGFEQLRNALTAERDRVDAERKTLESARLEPIASSIDKLDRRLRAEGSELAKARDEIGSEKTQLLLTMKQLEEQMRDLCSGTLPFALCPNTLGQLRKTLTAADDSLSPAARKRVGSATATVMKQFSAGTLDGSHSVDARTRKRVTEILSRAIQAAIKGAGRGSSDAKVDDLSPVDRSRLMSWIDSAQNEAGPEAQRLRDLLERATRRLQKMETALAQTPTEDSLRITVAELNDAHKALGAAQEQAASLDKELARIIRELADVDRRMALLNARVQQGADARARIGVVKRSQAALKDYLVALTALKLRQLEHEVTQCFSAICRKGDLVRQIRIDAETFNIVLLDAIGQVIPKERLSAGEKQVFAVALLWALGRTSGRPLPVIIDTPLARLDSDHRKLLIDRYLPAASHQVLVLSTDTEVDEVLFASLMPHVSHAYHLRYDDSEKYTGADFGYFWSTEVTNENTTSPVLQGSR